jgi:hypothetical protein
MEHVSLRLEAHHAAYPRLLRNILPLRVLRPPDPKVLKLHSGLQKAESSTLIQFRTGCTGLAHFLHKTRVPGIDPGLCSCRGGLKTPRHVLIHCTQESERREELRRVGGGSLDFRRLLDTPEGAGVANRWVVRSGRLHQFSLARALLYNSPIQSR